jgi:hypothetical protein
VIELIYEAERLCPHSGSVTALTPAFARAGSCALKPLHDFSAKVPTDQRLLRALIALEQFGREPSQPILWHPQLQRAIRVISERL